MYFKERPSKLYQCFFFMKLVYPQQAEIGSWLSQLLMAPGKLLPGERLSEIRILSKGYQFILCSVNFTDNSDILFKPT